MTIEVIDAGFGRTGTLSLKAALEELGFGPCYHMTELFENPEHIERWEAAAQGKPVDWDEVFVGYRATVDWPGGAFYEELMEKYPDAKVILTVRDLERWYESARSTIYGTQRVASSPIFPLLAMFVPRMRHMKRAGRMINAIAWEGLFDGRFEDKEYAIEAFERWNEEVKKRVPADRLLVYDVKQGWGPLCEFLSVTAPQVKPFPHLNDEEVFRGRIRRMRTLSVAVPAIAALAFAAALTGIAVMRYRAHRRL
jgi:Sulfotransferase domain